MAVQRKVQNKENTRSCLDTTPSEKNWRTTGYNSTRKQPVSVHGYQQQIKERQREVQLKRCDRTLLAKTKRTSLFWAALEDLQSVQAPQEGLASSPFSISASTYVAGQ